MTDAKKTKKQLILELENLRQCLGVPGKSEFESRPTADGPGNRSGRALGDPDQPVSKELQRLVHELEVHQIELEAQNEELRLTQKELLISRDRVFDLYDFAPVGYLTLDQKGRILEINLTGARLLGAERAFLVGKLFYLFMARKDRDRFHLFQRQLVQSSDRQTIELTLTGQNKTTFPALLEGTADSGDKVPIGQCRLSISDISERKKAEEALVRSEARYRSYIDLTDQMAWTVNSAGEATGDLPSWARFTGQRPDDLVGLGWLKALHPEDLEPTRRSWRKAVAGKKNFEVEYRVRRQDGFYRHFLVRAVPVLNELGAIREWVGTCVDITLRKQAEGVLSARLRILEIANRGTASVDDILQVALDEIEALTGSLIGFYHFLEADQETISLQNWSSNTLRNQCTAEGRGLHYPISKAGVWVECVAARGPVIHNDFISLPDRKGLPPGHAPVIREMVIPILRKGRIVALVGLGNKPSDYDQTDLEIASLLGDLSWEIVEHKRTDQALQERNLELKQLSESLDLKVRERTAELAEANQELHQLSLKLFSAEEEERKKIAGDIHDIFGSGLAALKFQFHKVQAKIRTSPEEAILALDVLGPMIKDMMAECRRMQQDLRPSTLDDLGLLATLSWFFRRFQEVHEGINVTLDKDLEEKEIPDALKIIIYRVVQEAMNNTAKYSQATQVRLSLGKSEEGLELVLQDNGQGFNIQQVLSKGNPHRGLGLSSMKERVTLSGGTFTMESTEGQGTALRASWPQTGLG